MITHFDALNQNEEFVFFGGVGYVFWWDVFDTQQAGDEPWYWGA
jgi:hypothetical protein